MAENFKEHLVDVINNEAPCTEAHDQEFAALADSYRTDETFLEAELAREVTPRSIFLSGRGLGTYLSLPAGTAYAGDPGEANATVERWVSNGETLVRFSKTRGWRNWRGETTTLVKQAIDHWGSFPGVRKRRTARIAAAVLHSADADLFIHAFRRPDELDDDAFWMMRQLASDYDFQRGHQSHESLMPINSTLLDADLLELRNEAAIMKEARAMAAHDRAFTLAREQVGPRPEVADTSTLDLDSPAMRWASELVRTATTMPKPEPTDEDIEQDRQYLMHKPLLELQEVVDGLRTAVLVTQNGRSVAPTVPQTVYSRPNRP